MLKKLTVVFTLLLLCLTAVAVGQDLTKRMTNKDVTDMLSLGLSEEVVIEKIRTAEATNFDTSIEALKALKEAKVPDAVIKAMVNPKAAALVTTAAVTAPTTKPNDGLPEEIGVYAMIKGKMVEVDPEVVNWRTGGVGKSMLTHGLTKGHTNGAIKNPKSALQTTPPVEFIIRTPEGTSVTEYQLLKLDEKGDRREFRAMTGGIIHASGGADKNAVEFQYEKVASRTFRIKLADLKKGEYGFLPPGVSSQSVASAGKIYTFGIIE